MRRIYLVLSILILIAVIYFAIMNFNNYISLNVLYSNLLDAQTKAGWIEQGGYFVKAIRLSTYTILVLLGGVFAGAGTVYMFLQAQTDRVKAYQRELEKTSITGTNNASRVEVLEAKIKTLEKAFNTVIDERTQLEVQIQSLNAELDKMNKDN